jgi:hypothetical protein
MGKPLKRVSAEAALGRVLAALERELIEASDEEIRAAAQELGMDLDSRECAAFAGLKFPSRPQYTDFFEPGKD